MLLGDDITKLLDEVERLRPRCSRNHHVRSHGMRKILRVSSIVYDAMRGSRVERRGSRRPLAGGRDVGAIVFGRAYRKAMLGRFWPPKVPMPLSNILGMSWRARQERTPFRTISGEVHVKRRIV